MLKPGVISYVIKPIDVPYRFTVPDAFRSKRIRFGPRAALLHKHVAAVKARSSRLRQPLRWEFSCTLQQLRICGESALLMTSHYTTWQ